MSSTLLFPHRITQKNLISASYIVTSEQYLTPNSTFVLFSINIYLHPLSPINLDMHHHQSKWVASRQNRWPQSHNQILTIQAAISLKIRAKVKYRLRSRSAFQSRRWTRRPRNPRESDLCGRTLEEPIQVRKIKREPHSRRICS